MIRLRRWSFVFCSVVTLAWACSSFAQPATTPKSGEEKWLIDRAMTVSPRAEPKPALKYRLLPMRSELTEGNAVPIYLRLNHEQSDAARKYWTENPYKWNELSADQLPIPEIEEFLKRMANFYKQFDYGARRTHADWNYTIEQPDPIGILLPDLQSMRTYGLILVLRTRMQIRAGDYAGAARSFETGFSFSRQVADEGPFLIGGLVGLAIANFHADRIPEWIERPDSPNLYWALTNLPRPLIEMRNAFDFEQRFAMWQFPELADLDRPRSPAEWDAALKRFRTELKRIYPMAKSEGDDFELVDADEPAAKSSELPAARKYVADRLGKTAAEVEAMPPAQILLLFIRGVYVDHRDDMFKIAYLPFAQAWPLLPAARDRLNSAPKSEGVVLGKLFLPALAKVIGRLNVLDRKFAMLRTIEAIRLHAAANGGTLPDALEQVTIVPVPSDPATGKPFEFKREGSTITLSSRLPGEPLEKAGLRYRLTLRGK